MNINLNKFNFNQNFARKTIWRLYTVESKILCFEIKYLHCFWKFWVEFWRNLIWVEFFLNLSIRFVNPKAKTIPILPHDYWLPLSHTRTIPRLLQFHPGTSPGMRGPSQVHSKLPQNHTSQSKDHPSTTLEPPFNHPSITPAPSFRGHSTTTTNQSTSRI